VKSQTLRTIAAKVRIVLLLPLAFALTVSFAQAQSSTTTARTPGTPTGSYQLGDADTINLFTGNLNYSLPLLGVGGRGEAQSSFGIAIEGQWDIQTSETPPPNQTQTHQYSFRSVGGIALVGSVTLDIQFIGTAQPCGSGSHFDEWRVALVYVEPDGTQHAMRDRIVHGMPMTICPGGSQNLGRIFESTSGDFATYVNDTNIYSSCYGVPGCTDAVDGYLYFRNGSKSRVVGGQIQWTQDRNGNKITYTYATGLYDHRLLQITDSLDRTIYIDSDVTDPEPYGLCTRLRFKGFGGTEKVIRISYTTDLAAVLRTTQPYDPPAPVPIVYDDPTDDVMITYGQFPGYHISAVWLPDGRSYQFKYNVLAQLARVVLPTGGALEFDYSDTSQLPFEGPPNQGGVPTITNAVSEKRVYDTGNILKSKMVFSVPTSYTPGVFIPSRGGVVRDMDLYEPNGTRLSKSRHYFHGGPDSQYGLLVPWWHGREFRAENFALNGSTLLRVSETSWNQVAPSWCSTVWPCSSNPAELAPTNNPFVSQTQSTLADGNLVSKTVSSYDNYNNQTNSWQYDFGVGQAGPLLKHIQNSYLNFNDAYGGTFFLGLTTSTSVYAVDSEGEETLAASTQTVYDEYTQFQLLTYAQATGWQSVLTPRGNPTTVKQWLDQGSTWIQTHAQFDQLGNVRRSWDALGRLTETDYTDAFTDQINHYTFALATQLTLPIPDSSNVHSSNTAFVSTVVYDYSTGHIKTSTDAAGQTTTYEYNDVLDRLKKVINPPGGGWNSFDYGDSVGNLYVKSTIAFDETHNVESYNYFDGLGRSVRSFTPKAGGVWIISDTEFDGAGRRRRVSKPYQASSLNTDVNPDDNWVTTEYDALGRMTKVRTADGSEASTAYDGKTVTATDADQKKRTTESDALGRLTKVIEDPGGTNLVVNYKYDILGNLRRVEQGPQRRYYMYDSLSRLIRSKNPEQDANPDLAVNDPIAGNDQWSMSINYFANGNVSAKTDARGIRADYLYDDLNRPVRHTYTPTRTLPTGTYTATPAIDSYYDGRGVLSVPLNCLGKVNRISSSVSETRFTGFDAMGHVTSSEQIIDNQTYQMSYTYNFAGALITETYPSGRVVTNSMDDVGSLSVVSGQAPNQSAKNYASNLDYSFTPSGAIRRAQLGNGRWETMVYNKRLQPTLVGLGTTQNGTDLMRLEYNYGTSNNNGNIKTQVITVPAVGASPGFTASQTYGYDELNRLNSAVETAGAQTNWRETFDYDDFGNRSVVTGLTTGSLVGDNPTISAADNRILPQSGEGYQYDANGNLIGDRSGNAYSFTGENSQASFTGPMSAQYFYDGNAQRVKKQVGSETTVFVYDALGRLIAEYSTSGAGGSGTTYLSVDNLGTPRVNTNQSGAVLARHDYLPYGEEISGYGGRGNHAEYTADSVRQKFTGLERDAENGLDYAHARYYASKAGRFTSVDPLMASATTTTPQTLNRYTYALNNPYRYVDPSGMEASEVDEAFAQLGALVDMAEAIREAQQEAQREAERKQRQQQQAPQQTSQQNAQQGQAPTQPKQQTGYAKIVGYDGNMVRRTTTYSCVTYDPFTGWIPIDSEEVGLGSDVVRATLVYSDHPEEPLGDQQPMFGKSAGDDRGHIIGRALGGPPDPMNLFSQDPDVNRKSYKKFETKIREELTRHKNWEARVRVELLYPRVSCDPPSGSFRPYALKYSVSYYSQPTDAHDAIYQKKDSLFFLNVSRGGPQ
jgi:RHS repeat-associated protein